MNISSVKAEQIAAMNLTKVSDIKGSAQTKPVEHTDGVAISRFASLLESARAKALGEPSIRVDLVEKAREMIENGQSHSSLDIAGAMLRHSIEGKVE